MKFSWFDTLVGRTVALLLVITLVLIIGAAFLFDDERHDQFDKRDMFHLAERIGTLVRLVSDADVDEQQRIINQFTHYGDVISITETPVVIASLKLPIERALSRRIGRNLKLFDRSGILVNIVIDGRNEYKGHAEVKLIQISVRLWDETWLNLVTDHFEGAPPVKKDTVIVFAVLLLGLFLLGYFSARHISKPMVQLGLAAERFGLDRSLSKMPEQGFKEVRHTIRAFNLMQERINKQIKDRSLMLAAVSHDLRTPITTLRLRAEYIEDKDMREKTFATLLEMEQILNVTLGFARDEAADEPLRETDLVALLNSLVDDHADLGHQVSFKGPEQLIISCHPVALRRALNNLIDNAIKYGNEAEVSLQQANGKVEIKIKDNGEGIPESSLEEVLTPFFRLEKSRNKNTGGVGLGLAVAKSIALSLGGDLILTNRKNKGLCALLLVSGR